jgi:hypothetical protein
MFVILEPLPGDICSSLEKVSRKQPMCQQYLKKFIWSRLDVPYFINGAGGIGKIKCCI